MRKLAPHRLLLTPALCSEKLDVEDHYVAWSQTHDQPQHNYGADGPFSFCSYPFLLNPRAKSKLLHTEARYIMTQVCCASVSNSCLSSAPPASCYTSPSAALPSVPPAAVASALSDAATRESAACPACPEQASACWHPRCILTHNTLASERWHGACHAVARPTLVSACSEQLQLHGTLEAGSSLTDIHCLRADCARGPAMQMGQDVLKL